MIEMKRDRKTKGEMWIITRTDSEGFHHQLALNRAELKELKEKIEILL